MAGAGVADMSDPDDSVGKLLQKRLLRTGQTGHDRGQTPVMARPDMSPLDVGEEGEQASARSALGRLTSACLQRPPEEAGDDSDGVGRAFQQVGVADVRELVRLDV